MIILLRILCVVVVVGVLNVFGIVGISYLRVLDNDPFPVAVHVKAMDNDHIELADGRVITEFGGLSSDDQDRINDSGGRIGCDIDSSGVASVYTRGHRTICGTGMPIFIIPLVPIDVRRYDRRLLVIGKIASK